MVLAGIEFAMLTSAGSQEKENATKRRTFKLACVFRKEKAIAV